MTEHEPFLRTIIERPDDDGPRLVYADWLEEQGECDRAEFIRVQCELATSRNGGMPAIHFSNLRLRERELQGKHWEKWVPEILALGRFDAKFRRGFVEEITCSWEAWGGDPSNQHQCEKCGAVTGRGPNYERQCQVCGSEFVAKFRGHAAAILAAQPVRKVKLTTRVEFFSHKNDIGQERAVIRLREKGRLHYIPHFEIDQQQDLHAFLENVRPKLLAAEWPGIEFELLAANSTEYRVHDEAVVITPQTWAALQRHLQSLRSR